MGAQKIKNLPAMQESWVWSLGQKIPGEQNDNPLQYFVDRGTWWATIYGVTKSWIWLSD